MFSSSKDTQRLCISSGTLFFNTANAFFVWLVTKTLFPCAKKCPIILAIVCVFPVPGGPCTKTALHVSILSTILSCSLFACLAKKISALSPPELANLFSIVSFSFSTGTSTFPSSTMSISAPGTKPVFSMFSIILLIAPKAPLKAFLKKNTGLDRTIIRSSYPIFSSLSELNFPFGDNSWTNLLRNTELFFLSSGWYSFFVISFAAFIIASLLTLFIFWNNIVYNSGSFSVSLKTTMFSLGSKSIAILFSKIGWFISLFSVSWRIPSPTINSKESSSSCNVTCIWRNLKKNSRTSAIFSCITTHFSLSTAQPLNASTLSCKSSNFSLSVSSEPSCTSNLTFKLIFFVKSSHPYSSQFLILSGGVGQFLNSGFLTLINTLSSSMLSTLSSL